MEKKKRGVKKELKPPMKFNVGTLNYEPDLNKLRKIKKKAN